MFSAKNYGLPKDLIEAAKKVHEKQLEEGAGKYAEPRMDPKIRNEKNPEVKKILHSLADREKEKMNKTLPGAKKSQAEEVQFTEEELAEAFAIFLEENFHVEMLTEEDLDYVFENEFPQWLEETAAQIRRDSREVQKEAAKKAVKKAEEDAKARREAASRKEQNLKARAASAASAAANTLPANQTTSGGTGPSSMVQGDTERGYNTSASVTTQKPVSAKPSASARKQTGGPSLFQQAKKAVRPTSGDSGRTATDRLRYMARRGNQASQRALIGPKKDWRTSVFDNQSSSGN